MSKRICLLVLIALSLSLTAIAQSNNPKTRLLKKIVIANEPVNIRCYSFGEGEDWLKDLSIEVENVSDHTILELECMLFLKYNDGFEHPIAIPLIYKKNANQQGVKNIPNGGTAKLKIASLDYLKAKEQVEKVIPLTAIESIEILEMRADYGSGLGWFKGIDYLHNMGQATNQTIAPAIDLNSCLGQVGAKRLNIVPALPPFGDKIAEPVKIIGQHYTAQDDWLKDLQVEIENSSGKNIKYIELILLICDIKSIDNCILIPMRYPANDESDLNSQNRPSEQMLLPGAKVKLVVANRVYENAKQLIEQYAPINTINIADIIIGQVQYQDGGGWNNQTLLRNFSWQIYKPADRAFLLSKEIYIWGYLRDRDRAYSDMYLGMEATHDDPVLEYEYDEFGHIKSVRVKGYVRKGGGYIRSNERDAPNKQQ